MAVGVVMEEDNLELPVVAVTVDPARPMRRVAGVVAEETDRKTH